MMLHEILIALRDRGHEVRVFDLGRHSGSFEGVEIVPVDTGKAQIAHEWADVVITQTNASTNASLNFGNRCPIVYINHEPKNFQSELPRGQRGLLVVFNSVWSCTQTNYSGNHLILPPPVDPNKYKTTRGNRITLVNLNQIKGGDIFWQLALALPDHQFLGVIGGYGHQIRSKTTPPNVKILETTTDMKSVYSQSRIVIMPSKIESYGRVGVEAFASGIPVIASPTDGLREALGDAGIFVSSRNVEHWVKEIKRLDNDDQYNEASSRAYQRSNELDPIHTLDKLEQAIFSLT
jgi:glycosyltransferase involved in cell wall biosynthesis